MRQVRRGNLRRRILAHAKQPSIAAARGPASLKIAAA
jgi:hypothetical protein